jgi:hypothetical protein
MSERQQFDGAVRTDQLGLDRTAGPTVDADPDEQVQEIRASIEQTRVEMSETIDELQERLNPTHLKEQLREQVREQYEHAKETVREATLGKVENMVERVSDTVYETRRTVVDTISANPIPSALVGIGLAWLWMSARNGSSAARGRSSSYDYGYGYQGQGDRYDEELGVAAYDQSDIGTGSSTAASARNLTRKAGEAVSNAAGRVQETASNLAARTKETVSGVAGQAQAKAAQWGQQAQRQAQRVEQRFESTMQENPLAIGALAVALGAAIGLAVPVTRRENELMGQARDRLLDKAQTVAHDTIEQVQQVAQKATGEGEGSSQERSTGQPQTV